MLKILITSVGTATSVGLIKALKKTCRALIIGVDISLYGYTAGSILVDKYYQVPLAKDSNYLIQLSKIMEENEIELLIPINDIEIETISRFGDENIKEKCIIPGIDVIDTIKDKLICSQNVRKIGISIPAIIKNDTKCKKIVRDRIGVGSKGIWIFEKEEVPQISDRQFVQKYIEGEEYTVDILSDREGVPVYIIPRKRLEVKSGVATKVKIENNSGLINSAKVILKEYRIPGFSNIQFIKEKNEYFFIEINYRFSGCGAASLIAADGLINVFLDIAEYRDIDKNITVLWDAIVTRYYEEVLYR